MNTRSFKPIDNLLIMMYICGFNGLAMNSSGIEAQNHQNTMKLIKIKYFNINHLPAIIYSCCYAFVIAGGINNIKNE